MTIKVATVQLVCDVCSKESYAAAPEVHIEAGWKWNRYTQMPGYNFYALTCSEACKAQWEAQYMKLLFLNHHSEIDLAKVMPANRETMINDNPFSNDLTFFARAYYVGTGEEHRP
jgi:hypothetical protein